ncbi:4'-phosphopantetheinyl transferase superfamily protein [Pirellulales bacterium]|nr:4'-phosphopantetheinyl transferase superfamily protein [Pirellulales bacterium]
MPQHSSAAWILTPEDWRPAMGDFHVWRASVERIAPLINTLRRHLVPEENARADRYFFDKDRYAFVVGRATLRAMIGHCLSQTPRDVKIVTNTMGKPRLPAADLHFNVSHSGNLVLIGLCLDRPVGVDVEQTRPIANLSQLAKRVLSAGDIQRVLEAEAGQREQAFYRSWTRKEAYAKAVGFGLTRGFQNFEILHGPDGIGRCAAAGATSLDPANYIVRDLKPGQGYVAAAAGAGMSGQISQWECVPNTILRWLREHKP